MLKLNLTRIRMKKPIGAARFLISLNTDS